MTPESQALMVNIWTVQLCYGGLKKVKSAGKKKKRNRDK